MLKPVLLLFFVEHEISLTEWPALFYAKKRLSNLKKCSIWLYDIMNKSSEAI